ncbi:MAG: RsmD family RNA methyltransferase, partial [Nannocystaceae bacterium]
YEVLCRRHHMRRMNSRAAQAAALSADVLPFDLDACPVLEPVLAAAMFRVRTLADLLPTTGSVVGLTDGTRVVLGLPGVRPTPEVAAACQQLLDDTLVGIELRGGRERADIGQTQLDIDDGGSLPPVRANAFAFAQASEGPNAALVEHVSRVAKAAGKRVLEGYAGSGNLTRALAQTARSVWAIESEREAVARLEGLAEDTGLPIKVRRANLERVLPRMARKQAEERQNRGYEVVVVDPPRRGLGKDVAHALTKLARERIVVVSCDPATLARDLEVMVANGFALRHVTVFDLMPMTSEVEVVAMLERRPG